MCIRDSYNGQSIDANSAFSMELFTILVGLSILSISKKSSTIYSDCESAVKKLNKLLVSPSALRASSRDVHLLTAALAHLRNGVGTLQWIKGHPERAQKDETLWTREMWGNHLADRAAAGILSSTKSYQNNNDSVYILNITSLPAQDASTLSSSLTTSGSWYLGRSNRQLSASSISEEVNKQRLEKYLQDRDANRAERLLPPKWQQYNIPLAATLWELPNSNRKTSSIKVLFDKHWHPGNQIKSIVDPILRATIGKCPLCVEDDSAAHWTVHCKHPRAISIRAQLATDLRLAVSSVMELLPEHKVCISYFGNEYMEYIFGSENNPPIPDTWRGLWTASQLDSFRQGSESEYIPHACAAALKKLFITLGRILTTACSTLWYARQVTINELESYMKLHPDPNLSLIHI